MTNVNCALLVLDNQSLYVIVHPRLSVPLNVAICLSYPMRGMVPAIRLAVVRQTSCFQYRGKRDALYSASSDSAVIRVIAFAPSGRLPLVWANCVIATRCQARGAVRPCWWIVVHLALIAVLGAIRLRIAIIQVFWVFVHCAASIHPRNDGRYLNAMVASARARIYTRDVATPADIDRCTSPTCWSIAAVGLIGDAAVRLPLFQPGYNSFSRRMNASSSYSSSLSIPLRCLK